MNNTIKNTAAIEFTITVFKELTIPSEISKPEFFFMLKFGSEAEYLIARRIGMGSLPGGRATRSKLWALHKIAMASASENFAKSSKYESFNFDAEGAILSKQEYTMIDY